MMGSNYYFETEQLLPISMDEAWTFFSTASNLATITPPELDFRILTDLNGAPEIYEGMLINYKVKPLLGIPVKWQTQITKVNKPFSFTDKQLTGPYRSWIHSHYFIEKKNGVLMKDEVIYRLPFGVFGMLTHRLLVKKKIEGIFEYRRRVIEKLFSSTTV